MKCAFHPNNVSTVRCSSCEYGLCPGCDHRIKGLPYCQDCIVAGIEALRLKSAGPSHKKPAQGEKSPLIAVLMGLIPGLGAAYNGQNVKALIHFTATLGFITLADIFTDPLGVVMGFGAAASYIYSIYDAYRSAKGQRIGLDLQAEDDRLKIFLRENTRLLGGLLLGVGSLSILNLLIPEYLGRFWPILMIIAGLILLRGYQLTNRSTVEKTVYRTPPPSVIPSTFDKPTEEFARSDRSREDGIYGN